jgi:hypothetical protein
LTLTKRRNTVFIILLKIESLNDLSSETTLSIASSLTGLELLTLSSSTVLPFFFLPLLVVDEGGFGAIVFFFGLTLRRDRLGASDCNFGVGGGREAAFPLVSSV